MRLGPDSAAHRLAVLHTASDTNARLFVCLPYTPFAYHFLSKHIFISLPFYRERVCFLLLFSLFFFGSLGLSAFLCWLGDVLKRRRKRSHVSEVFVDEEHSSLHEQRLGLSQHAKGLGSEDWSFGCNRVCASTLKLLHSTWRGILPWASIMNDTYSVRP